MIHCIIIDDEPLARQMLKDFISKVPNLTLVGDYSSPLKAMDVLSKNAVDALFLDIQMPGITGIDFLKTLNKKLHIIFTTAYPQYAIEGFELDAVDYLLKPFDFNRFLKAVNKLTSVVGNSLPVSKPEVSAEGHQFIFVKDGTKLIKIDFDSILYIEGFGDYVKVVAKGKTITSLKNLKDLQSELPEHFIRIHNSYIISVKAIDAIHQNNVLIGEKSVPIGITYKKSFFDLINYRNEEK
jgi:two-component system LytT family response regulator